jgi:hypothetical protein
MKKKTKRVAPITETWILSAVILVLLIIFSAYVVTVGIRPNPVFVYVPHVKHGVASPTPGGGGQTQLTDLEVPIYIQTGSYSVNALELSFKFDSASFQVTKTSLENSVVGAWIHDYPSINNNEGTVDFVGGIPNGTKGKVLIATLTVHTLKEAKSYTFEVLSKTKFYQNDVASTLAPLKLKQLEF